MSNLALFDLDHTLLPIDSDYEWGQFLVRAGVVDAQKFALRNAAFFEQYQRGTLDPIEYLQFSLGTMARFPRPELDALHARYMQETILPAITPQARALLQKHHDAGDLVAIVTATNRYVTAPIVAALGVEHIIAAVPEEGSDGRLTGKLVGHHTSGSGKVLCTRAWLEQRRTTLDAFPRSYFYSDSHNDIPLLSIVTDPVATNPNAALAAHAAQQGWPSLHLFND